MSGDLNAWNLTRPILPSGQFNFEYQLPVTLSMECTNAFGTITGQIIVSPAGPGPGQEFLAWLSGKAGQTCCLPSESESEWEYAARAETSLRFNTGTCITSVEANIQGSSPAVGCPSGIDRGETLPVASFLPNAFGVFDMHGNVWERVADCWNAGYAGAPTNGSAWLTGDCDRWVQRGGSWFNGGAISRSVRRSQGLRSVRYGDNDGFRVARDLN